MKLLFFQISVKDINFKGHRTVHFTVVLHQVHGKDHIIFGLVIRQTVSRCFLRPSKLLEEFFALFIVWQRHRL